MADSADDVGPLASVKIAVVGAGLVGSSWAALFAHYGADVSMWDPAEDARAFSVERSQRALAQLTEVDDTPAAGQIRVVPELAQALAQCVLVQECAPESVDVKQTLFAQIEHLAPEGAIIASSTSALRWSTLSPAFARPERFITAHPFNPPHLVPLVELYGIDESTLDQAEALYTTAGRVPVRLLQDATGHIANRLASALWREAVHIVADGIADVETVDTALVNGPGLRWSTIGAHMAYHLGGGEEGLAGYLEHLGPSQERRWADLGDPRLDEETRATLIAGIETEAAGRSIAELEAARDERLIAARRAFSSTSQ